MQVVGYVLRNEGSEFATVGRGREAVEYLSHGPAALILLGTALPNHSGLEVQRQIRADER